MENINCLVMGDNKVGKTSLLKRITDNKFYIDYVSSKNDFYQTNFIYESTPLSLTFMELSQQNIHFYSKIDIFIICFSLDINLSTLNIYCKWINQINYSKPIIFVRTKADLIVKSNTKLFNAILKRNTHKINNCQISNYILNNTIETSAKNNFNIDKLLNKICKKYYDNLIEKQNSCIII